MGFLVSHWKIQRSKLGLKSIILFFIYLRYTLNKLTVWYWKSPTLTQKREDTHALVIPFCREFLLPTNVCKGFFCGCEHLHIWEKLTWEAGLGRTALQDRVPSRYPWGTLQLEPLPRAKRGQITVHFKWNLPWSPGIVSGPWKNDSSIYIYLYPTCLQRVWGIKRRKRNRE